MAHRGAVQGRGLASPLAKGREVQLGMACMQRWVPHLLACMRRTHPPTPQPLPTLTAQLKPNWSLPAVLARLAGMVIVCWATQVVPVRTNM